MPQRAGKKGNTEAESHYHTHKINRNKAGRVSRDALYWLTSPITLALWIVRLFVSMDKVVTEDELADALAVIEAGEDRNGKMQEIADRYAQQATDSVDTHHAYRNLDEE